MALSDMYSGGNKTPFSNALGNFMQARQMAATNRLMGPAMSGDLSALNQLMSYNPEAGMQVQQRMAQQQQMQQQQEQQALENEMQNKQFGMQEEEFGLKKQMLERQLNAGPEPIKLGKGDRLVDPETFKILAGSEIDPQEGAAQSTALRKELADLSKTFAVQDDAYGRILASAKDPSPAGDMALIFSYMKVLDPTSSVREGEYATAANAGSIPTRIQAAYNKAIEGKGLDEKQRIDFVNRGKMLYSDAADKQLSRESRYKTLAEKAKLDPSDVVDNMVNFRDPDYQAIVAPKSAGKNTKFKDIGDDKLLDGL